MPLTRQVIEQFSGVARNPIEGSPAPRVLKNLAFDRAGGLVPFGRRVINLSESTTNSALLAYDESTMALFAGPSLWTNTRAFLSLSSTFPSASDLTLVPRGGVLSPFAGSFSSGVSGAAFVREAPNGVFGTTGSAPAVTVTEPAGTATIPAGTYQFVWWVEAPTDAGLVTYAVGYMQQAITGGATKAITLTTTAAVPNGHVVRWYYRRDEAGFMRFATKVGDGGTMAATLTEVGSTADDSFVFSNDAIMNFGPGRAEVHEGRVWGVARENPFLPLLPDSARERTDAYFTRSLSEDKSAVAVSATAGQPFRAAGDTLEFNIPALTCWRGIGGTLEVVPLLTMVDAADSTRVLSVELRHELAGSTPYTRLTVSASVGGGFSDSQGADVTSALPALAAGSESVVRYEDVQVVLEVATVNVDSGIEFDITITRGQSAKTFGPVVISGGYWLAGGNNLVRPFASSGGVLGAVRHDSWTVQANRVRAYDASALADEFDMNVTNYSTGLTFTSGGHTWTLASTSNVVVTYSDVDVGEALTVSQPAMTVVYSNVGAANRGWQENVITLNATASSRITALASTPAGLLVFMENETWLISGNVDPYQGNAQVQRLSGTLGCDANVIPARLGGVVFPIYKGELYAVNMGMGDVDFGSGIENIGRPVWLREDPFVQAVGESQTNHVVALMRSGKVYRYDATVKQWFDDPMTGLGNGSLSSGVDEMLQEVGNLLLLETGDTSLQEAAPAAARMLLIPANLDTEYGTVYLVISRFETVAMDSADSVSIRWEDLDLGDRYQHKLWRRVEVATNSAYAGTPTLTYSVDGRAEQTVTGVSSGNGVWVFNLKRGEVGVTADLEVAFPGMLLTDVIEPPVTIEVAPRYRSRGRVA